MCSVNCVAELTCLEVRTRHFKPFRISLDLSVETHRFLHSILSRGELYDEPLALALTDPLGAGDTFIDIGSHIGYFSVLAMQRVSPGGEVWAFEPNRRTSEYLKANAELNEPGNFHVMNVALGDTAGTGELSINTEDEGMCTLLSGSGEKESVRSRDPG